MKETTVEAPAVNPVLEKELRELVKSRQRNTEKVGQVILKMITEKPGGLNERNQAEVFQYLHKTFLFTMTELSEYVLVGRKLLLAEIFDMPTTAARLAARLSMIHQRKLVFEGVEVVFDVNKPGIKKKLHQFSREEAERVIDVKRGIRDRQAQCRLMQSVPPPHHKRIVEGWPSDKNSYARVWKRMPLIDLEYLAKEVKKLKLPSISDPEIRRQIDEDLAAEFPPPQGASRA